MINVIATNKKATHDYFVLETVEAGVKLVGCEVKSIRAGEVNLKDSYCEVKNGQLILVSCYIKNYDKGSFSNVESRRDRVLLLHKRETMRLFGKVKEKGLTLVPLKMYFKESLVKVEVALVKGKQLFDKRESLRAKDLEREQQRDDSN